MKTRLAKIIFIFSTVLFCSCIVPEKFVGKYTLAPNGDYTFTYDGTMVNSLARMSEAKAKKKGGEPGAKDEAIVRDMVNDFRKDERIKKFTELSFDTWRVRTEEKGNLIEKSSVPFWNAKMQLFTLNYDPDNKMASFIIKPLGAKSLKALDDLGITPDWKLQFATDCEVVYSNVKLDKSFFGNTYTFFVARNNLTSGVEVVFQLSPPR